MTGYAASINGRLCTCSHGTFDAAFTAHAAQNGGRADYITRRPARVRPARERRARFAARRA